MNLLDIIGPVMVGPSSSHTAGAVKIGRVAQKLIAEKVIRADIFLHGSFLATGKGHGTDKALVAGLLGMTVDDLMTAVNNGSVVFYNINATKTVWDKTAPNAGKMAWSYDKNGKISTENAVATVSLDTANKTINVDVPENSAAGVSITENLGFAINNGKDYDDYVRFNLSISVTDPGLIMPTITIPEGDYNSFEIEFSKYAHAIETCMGMTVKEFNEMVQDTDNDIALYMVETDGKWDTESKYTANGLGYWLDVNGKVVGWGDTCQTFVETHDGNVGIGRYPGIASGTTCKLHFVYASKTDASKFVEFIVNVTFA